MRKAVLLFVLALLATPVYGQNTFSIDFPVISKTITVDSARIKDLTVHTGPVSNPWAENLRYDFAPIPEPQFLSKNLWLHAFAYKHFAQDDRLNRKSHAAFLKAKSGFWHIYVSGEGFIAKEKALGLSGESTFNSEFLRQSQGSKGWLGVKFGQFNKNFILVKAAQGYIYTKGQRKLTHPSLSALETFDLYSEQFRTESFGLETGLKVKMFAFLFEGENINYKRVVNSPNPFRYGLNRFSDTRINLDVELVPLKKFGMIRVVVRGSHVFGENHSLLFYDSNPPFQAFIRLAIK